MNRGAHSVHAAYLVVDPWSGAIRPDATVDYDHDGVTAVRDIDRGSSTKWVLPALADAHDHGRGLATIAFGAADQALECWIPALSLQPSIDPGLLAAYALAKLARSGITAAVHCHNPQDPDRAVEEAEAVCRAAREVGVRLAYVVPMADRNPLGYGPTDEILSLVEPSFRHELETAAARTPLSPGDQVALVEEIAVAVEGPGVSVQYGPVGPQWVTDELCEAVADASRRTGHRTHLHLFETRIQREWADAHYSDGLIEHLDRIGLLSPRLTVAHGVWLDDAELELLAERGVLVSVNTSSNLRLRSGVAPVDRMRRCGIEFAFGMDGMSLDDDEDALRELRLTQLLHAGVGLDPGLSAREALGRATSIGHTAVDGSARHGTIEVGAAADLLVLDGAAIAADVADGAADTIAVTLARACADHVVTVVAGGRTIVDDGRVLGVDEAAIGAEIAAACRGAADTLAAARPAVEAHQRALERFYRSGGHRRSDHAIVRTPS